MRSFARAALASLFLFAQAALALHHHEHGLAVRSRAKASIQASDNCALCAFQIQPRTSTPEPVALAASFVSVATLSDVPTTSPRAARVCRLGARAPPAA